MEPEDVLTDHVQVGRPVGRERLAMRVREADGGDVVGQRVEPDVHDVRGIAGYRNSPVEGGPRHREILQAAPDEAGHFVAAGNR
jgi:hypothetical protein